MKKQLLLTLIISVFSLQAQSQCSPSPSNIYSFTINKVNYEIVREKLNWANAAACAVTRGGKLVEINSKTEQDSLFYYVNKAGIVAANTTAPDGGGASYLWIGGNDLAIEGNWVWNGDNNGTSTQFWQGDASGSPVGGRYNNWGNEPDNYNDQDGLGFAFTNWPLGVAGQWNDISVSNLLYFIVEYANTNPVFEIKNNPYSFYPNPVSDILTVNINIHWLGSTYTITDPSGRTVLTGKLISENSNINIRELIDGIYYFKIGEQSKQSFKVIKK